MEVGIFVAIGDFFSFWFTMFVMGAPWMLNLRSPSFEIQSYQRFSLFQAWIFFKLDICWTWFAHGHEFCLLISAVSSFDFSPQHWKWSSVCCEQWSYLGLVCFSPYWAEIGSPTSTGWEGCMRNHFPKSCFTCDCINLSVKGRDGFIVWSSCVRKDIVKILDFCFFWFLCHKIMLDTVVM